MVFVIQQRWSVSSGRSVDMKWVGDFHALVIVATSSHHMTGSSFHIWCTINQRFNEISFNANVVKVKYTDIMISKLAIDIYIISGHYSWHSSEQRNSGILIFFISPPGKYHQLNFDFKIKVTKETRYLDEWIKWWLCHSFPLIMTLINIRTFRFLIRFTDKIILKI